jgi:hypothetical protein
MTDDRDPHDLVLAGMDADAADAARLESLLEAVKNDRG